MTQITDESQLEFVKPGEESVYVNLLLYGPPKSGKTVGAASAPGETLYLNADRPNATRMAHQMNPGKLHEVHVDDLQTLLLAASLIQAEPDRFETVVVDPVAEVYRSILEGLSGRALRPKIQEYGDTGTHLERFCRYLCDAPVNAVFVAHETSVKDEETGGFERLPYTGTNNPAIAAKLMAMVDVIAYTGSVTDDDGTRYLAQLVNGRGRRGGDRFGVLGTDRTLDLTEWVDLARSSTEAEGAAG